MRDHVIGVDDLDVVHRFDISGSDHAFALLPERQRRLLAVVQFQHDAFQVEQNVDDILLHAVDGRIFVQHAAHRDFGRGMSGHRRQQNAAQGVAERVAVAALERFHRHFGVERRNILDINDTRLKKSATLHGLILSITSSKARPPAIH